MSTSVAVVMEEPGRVALEALPLDDPTAADVVVETAWTGVSAGTERLLYKGLMPTFPGMGYPLVPGYETVGFVVAAGPDAKVPVGSMVYVPGAHCFGAVRGIHGGAASRLVTAGARVVETPESLGEEATLLALAATALHAWKRARLEGPRDRPVLIVGHGALGRLLARIAALAEGPAPVVWESQPQRREGALGYHVTFAEEDTRRDYRVIFDVSGAAILDQLIQRLAPRGQIVLAGFYDQINFVFPPAFMREADIRIAAQWAEGELQEVVELVASGRLSLKGLITHRRSAKDAAAAYPQAFDDPECLKMILDWRSL